MDTNDDCVIPFYWLFLSLSLSLRNPVEPANSWNARGLERFFSRSELSNTHRGDANNFQAKSRVRRYDDIFGPGNDLLTRLRIDIVRVKLIERNRSARSKTPGGISTRFQTSTSHQSRASPNNDPCSSPRDLVSDEIMDIKFLCLNGTVFDQETRVCERVDEVDCSKSERFYNLNLELYGNNAVTLR